MLDCFSLWGERYAFATWWDRPPGPDWQAEPTHGREGEIARAALREGFHGLAARIADAIPPTGPIEDRARHLARALEDGTLRLFRAPRPSPGVAWDGARGGDEGAAVERERESSVPRRREPDLTWVAFKLFDLEQRPLASERFELLLPDGSSRSGTTDEEGFARVDAIPVAGTCELTLPDLDESYWQYGWAR